MENRQIIRLEQELLDTQSIGKTTFHIRRTFTDGRELLTHFSSYIIKNLHSIERDDGV